MVSDESKTPTVDTRSTLTGQLNVLRWLAAEEVAVPFNADTTLEWVCASLSGRPLLQVLRYRYAHFKNADNELFFFPTTRSDVVQKVLIPLFQAKAAFVLGHELSCIAMCGMVGEMLTIVRFEMSRNTLTRAQQGRLLGGLFENIQQRRRVQLLELMGMLDTETANELNDLGGVRNTYLHNLSKPHDDMWRDAVRAYKLAVRLTAKILGFGLKNGQVTISPEFLDYLKQAEADSSRDAEADR